MIDIHIAAGVFILAMAVGFLATRYFRTPLRGVFRAWGWAGLATIFLAEMCFALGVTWVRIFFTPLAWTGYLLLTDAAVYALRGRSRLGISPKAFFGLAFFSIPLWLVFEAYNLRLKNWAYAGLPLNPALDVIGYGWSFATIWPAIFETADFIEALGLFGEPSKAHSPIRRSTRTTLAFAGLLFLTVPIVVPARMGQYLFALVWVGFIVLLDPINYAWGGHSLLRDWEEGNAAVFKNFLAGGMVCGLLWEFWNYWAGAQWRYIFPIAPGWKIFEMPLPGYLGFPAFAVECLVMYEFLQTFRMRWFGSRAGKPAEKRWVSASEPK